MKKINIKLFLTTVLILSFTRIFAHVKWFSSFSFLDKSKELSQVIDITFIGLTLFSLLVVAALIFLDKRLKNTKWGAKLIDWLNAKQKYSNDVIRIGMFTVLIISWVNNRVFTPELEASIPFIAWIEFIVAVFLLIKVANGFAGYLILGLYVYCMYEFGFFYMLDYYHFVGIAIYIITINSKSLKIQSIGLPALYVTLGLALIWLAYEKLFYPSWGLYILEENPYLSLGLSPDFFLKGAAFVEIGLGFVLLLGILGRPMAFIITLVFILTSVVFGKTEVIGHTSLHAMLIVFILHGTGDFYKSPIDKLNTLFKKITFAVVGYLVLNAFGLFMYDLIADYQFNVASEKSLVTSTNHCSKKYDVSLSENIPKITKMEIIKEPKNMGYNLHVLIDNWTFTPQQAGDRFKENQGHLHIYVNGDKVGRMYSNWFYLGDLPKGKHKVSITLNGDDHTAFTIENTIIGSEKELVIE